MPNQSVPRREILSTLAFREHDSLGRGASDEPQSERESLVVLFPLCGDQLPVVCEVVVPRSREMAWLLDKSPSSRRYVELADRADHHVAHTVIDERIFARLPHDRVQDHTLPR